MAKIAKFSRQRDFRYGLWIILQDFYARKQLLLSARLSHRNSVCPSVCPSNG